MFVVKNYQYIALALLVGAFVLGAAILLPNFELLWLVWSNGSIGLADKAGLLFGLLGSLTASSSPLAATTMVVTALLVGVNVSLIVYLYRRQKKLLGTQGVAVSSVGVLLGMFGVGCAACGSLVLTAFLSSFGGLGLLTLLPLRGQEVSLVGMLVLMYATYFLIRNITKPVTCDI